MRYTALRWSIVAITPLLLLGGMATATANPDESASPGREGAPESLSGCPVYASSQGHAHRHEGEPHQHTGSGPLDVDSVDFTELYTFRPEEGQVAHLRYRLTEPARVRIRIKAADTRELFLATVVNFELREAGEHTETWDGRDYSGEVVDMSQAVVNIIARKAGETPGTMPFEPKSPEEIVHGEEAHRHGTHHMWAEEVPFLRIEQPVRGAEVSGMLLIRSAVDADRRGYGDQHGYGVRYYVDGTLVREEFYKPESDGQFAYRLDTTAFQDGEHLLQIGMCDHHEHATSASVPVVFRNHR